MNMIRTSSACFKRITSVLLLTALCSSLTFAADKPEILLVSTSIQTVPAGAAVTINGVPSGTTPFTAELEPGKHLFKFEREGYEPAFQTVDNRLPSQPKEIKLRPINCPVLIVSTPEGAEVLRDGATVGVTPLLLPEVPLGRYRIDLNLSGFRPQQVDLSVSSTKPQRINVQFASSSAAIDISSVPFGANVSINGIPRGTTPLKIDRIPEGQSTLEITADGYAPFREQIKVVASEVFTLHATLKALPSSLLVRSIPEGARVYIDNQYKGETPYVAEDLSGGSYRVRVEKDGYEIAARTVTLAQNSTVSEEFRLMHNLGTIRVSTSPANVSIFVAGKQVGKTTSKSDETDQVSSPLDITSLPIGPTEIVFQRPGYVDARQNVEINRDQITVVETVTLTRLFVPDVEITTPNGSYKGVFISRDAEFIRIETSPGIIRAFPVKDSRIRLIRDENVSKDLEE